MGTPGVRASPVTCVSDGVSLFDLLHPAPPTPMVAAIAKTPTILVSCTISSSADPTSDRTFQSRIHAGRPDGWGWLGSDLDFSKTMKNRDLTPGIAAQN